MSNPNPHALMNAAWAKVLQAVSNNRADPAEVAKYLDLLIDEGAPELVRQGLPPCITRDLGILGQPIKDLNLSIRARKALDRLGIQTIGDLVLRTPDELREVKNFGLTSLNELREILARKQLKLRGD